MNNDYKQLLEELSKLNTKVAITDYFINSFKEQEWQTVQKLETIKSKLQDIETQYYNQFKDLERESESSVENIKLSLESVSESLTNVKDQIDNIKEDLNPIMGNPLLQITSNMDFKKWITLISIVLSILASAGLLDSFISSQPQPADNQLGDRLEELLELAE